MSFKQFRVRLCLFFAFFCQSSTYVGAFSFADCQQWLAKNCDDSKNLVLQNKVQVGVGATLGLGSLIAIKNINARTLILQKMLKGSSDYLEIGKLNAEIARLEKQKALCWAGIACGLYGLVAPFSRVYFPDQHDFFLRIMPSVIPLFLTGYLLKSAAKEMQEALSTASDSMSKINEPKFDLIDAKNLQDFSLTDVVMPACVRRGLEDFEFCLKNLDKINEFKATVPRGILFSGPPGCGKSLVAKSFASKLNVNFICINGSEFMTSYIASGAVAVRKLFEFARKNTPCVIFIDEIDSIARKRSASFGGFAEYDRALNQLLAELDGKQLNKKWDGIIVVGATNFKESLDPAVLRAGRLGLHLTMELPDIKSRRQLFVKNLSKSGLEFSKEDLDDLAGESFGMSGAGIYQVVNQVLIDYAKKIAVEPGAKLKMDLVFDALERVQLGEPDDRLFDMAPEEKMRTAIHESGHALVALLTPKAHPLRKITVTPRVGGALGLTLCLPEKEFTSMDSERYQAEIKVCLGGLVAELIFFGEHSDGVSSDLVKATNLAKLMISRFAMSEFGPLVAVDNYAGDISQATKSDIENIAKKIITKNLEEVKVLLLEPKNKTMLEKLAKKLLEEKTMSRQAVDRLLELPLPCFT